MNSKRFEIGASEQPLDIIKETCGFAGVFKQIGVIGDSLASGEFESHDENGNIVYTDMYEYSWPAVLERIVGTKYNNYSRGGMTASEYIDSFAESRGFWDKDKAAQAYVIALGVNDIYNQHREIGTLEDVHPEDYTKNAKNFIGYYAQIVSRYKEISPDAKFFFVTFPKETRRSDNEDTAKEPFEKHPDMVLRLKDIAMFVANWEDKAGNIRHIQPQALRHPEEPLHIRRDCHMECTMTRREPPYGL